MEAVRLPMVARVRRRWSSNRVACCERDDQQDKRREGSSLRKRSVTKRHKARDIVAKLAQVERLAAGGRPISDCVREIGVTEVTYYRWRSRYGRLESDQAEQLAELEAEISRLRRAVSDLTMDKLILVEATTGALSPELRSAYVHHAKAALGISERRACQALGQHRSTQRKIRARLSQEAAPAGNQRHSAGVRSPSTLGLWGEGADARRLAERDA